MQDGMTGGQGVSSGTPESTQTSVRSSAKVAIPGIEYTRFFTREGVDPFDEVEWDIRAAVIGNEKGHVVFEQRDVEIPRFQLLSS